MAVPHHLHPDRLLVQIASYNTNLQGVLGLPQDLVDWLAPTFQVSSFLSKEQRAPDIVAVGFQELLPLHLGLAGLSKAVIEDRSALIQSQIEKYAPHKERYSLISKVVNVGVALVVFGLDGGVARRACDVQTQWTGCGPCFMGNKGAVGVRFRIPGPNNSPGETYTFVNCHLAAYDHNLKRRIADYQHIVRSLLFSPAAEGSSTPSTLYDTSNLFFLGDFNFRLDIPDTHPLAALRKRPEFGAALTSGDVREELKAFDQLSIEKQKGTIFVGLHEAEFWKFKCTYKYKLGKVDEYSSKRTPAWTDRVLYATHSDSADTPEKSNIDDLLYTSIPSYTTSDHKPVVCLLLLPLAPSTTSSAIPTIALPSHYTPIPDSLATLKRYMGRSLDRLIGCLWWIVTILGAGSGLFGLLNLIFGIGGWTWWKSKTSHAN